MSVIKVALLGFGTVGEGVYRTIQSHQEELTASLGKKVEVAAVLIKNTQKKRNLSEDVLITTNFNDILALPQVDVVFEAIVEKEPSFSYLKAAIAKGCHIITANKEMFAHHGRDLLRLAQERGVSVGFEATVAGGVPVIQTVQQLLRINNVSSIQGILNGTSNFILTEMRDKNQSFIEALKLAQKNGYAEADPGNDINGCDAYFKLMVLSGIAFDDQPELRSVKINGISDISIGQIRLAESIGLRFKHIASVVKKRGRLEASVIPTLVSKSHPFYHVEGVQNAVNIRTDLVGNLTLQGPGAGMFPTASAMIEDLVGVYQRPFVVKQRVVSREVEEVELESSGYWFVFNVKKSFSLNAFEHYEQLSPGGYVLKGSKEQLKELRKQNYGLAYYPILGEFELVIENKGPSLTVSG